MLPGGPLSGNTRKLSGWAGSPLHGSPFWKLSSASWARAYAVGKANKRTAIRTKKIPVVNLLTLKGIPSSNHVLLGHYTPSCFFPPAVNPWLRIENKGVQKCNADGGHKAHEPGCSCMPSEEKKKKREPGNTMPPASKPEVRKDNGLRGWWRRLSLAWKILAGLVAFLAASSTCYLFASRVFCLWPEECPPDIGIVLAESRFNPMGEDNPSDEYVCLHNEDDDKVQLTGWLLRDSHRDIQVLPDFALETQHSIRVHPGIGVNSLNDLFGSKRTPVWNNNGDSVFLVDNDGQEIDSKSYGPRGENDNIGSCETP